MRLVPERSVVAIRAARTTAARAGGIGGRAGEGDGGSEEEEGDGEAAEDDLHGRYRPKAREA
jgi:hypothetical protein